MSNLQTIHSENEALFRVGKMLSQSRHPSTDCATGASLMLECESIIEGLQIQSDMRGDAVRGDILETLRVAIVWNETTTANAALERLAQ